MTPFTRHMVAHLLFVIILMLGVLGLFLIGMDPMTNLLMVAGLGVAIKIDDHFVRKNRHRTI